MCRGLNCCYISTPPNPIACFSKAYSELDSTSKRQSIGKLGGLRRGENLRQNPRPAVVKDQELEAIAQVGFSLVAWPPETIRHFQTFIIPPRAPLILPTLAD